MSFAKLGPITFEVTQDTVRTWQDVQRTRAGRWHQHEVFAGKPLQEFLGPGLDALVMPVRLDLMRGVNPRDELRQMNDLVSTGTVAQFTIGREFIGDFILKLISEDWKRFVGSVLVVATATLTLEEYV